MRSVLAQTYVRVIDATAQLGPADVQALTGLPPAAVARTERRAAAGLPERSVELPKGQRTSNKLGVPRQAYRRDTLSMSYRRTRVVHAQAASAATRRQEAFAREVARQIVGTHGPNVLTEDVDVRQWQRLWGGGIAAFTPGRLLAALGAECEATGGAMVKANTFETALSQHCICGRREKKPLSKRTHECPACGFTADRDLTSAILAATVRLADPADPRTAYIDPILLEHARSLIESGQSNLEPPRAARAAQQDGAGPVNHQPQPQGSGESGSHKPRLGPLPDASGTSTAPPRKTRSTGARRTRRTARPSTTIPALSGAEL